MRSLNRAAALLAALVLPAVALALPGTAYPAMAVTAAPQAAQDPAGGGCSFQPVNGGFRFICNNTISVPGRPGSGGGGAKSACTLTALSPAQQSFFGLQRPPANHSWEAITCPGGQAFSGVTLVSNATGAPAVTPQELAQIAIGELIIPTLAPGTAPPVGKDGLVGLPEWFWIPAADWQPVHKTVTAGPVWATATAVPETMTFDPGGGLPGFSCKGPGVAYQPKLPLSAQHTDCAYTYDQPSAGQPGNAYAASLVVSWNVSWVGSGGAGGPVATGRPVTTPLILHVAAGEALVTGQ